MSDPNNTVSYYPGHRMKVMRVRHQPGAKPWPMAGKNRAARARLQAGFAAMASRFNGQRLAPPVQLGGL